MTTLGRFAALLLLVLSIAAGVAAPVATAGVLDYGATVDCRYRVTATYNGNWTQALLRKLIVGPPTMPKTASGQTVGWRFVVKRAMDARDNYPYIRTYRSPIQRATKSSQFSVAAVGVTVPSESNTPIGRRFVSYQVTIKMFWYGADGSVLTTKSHLMENMDWIMGGEEQFTDTVCPGKAEAAIDGE